jgi:hypothetical protein
VKRDTVYNGLAKKPYLPIRLLASGNSRKIKSMNGCEPMGPGRLGAGMTEKNNQFIRFGFSFARGGAHTSRTIMLEELKILLAYVDRPDAEKSDYLHAIDMENCLGKRSGKTRILTYRHLVDLYSLDCSNILFRTLLFFWNRDSAGQCLLALLCAYARDSVFRSTAPFILKFSEGAIISREALEAFIDSREPGRFSKATLKSTAQNINSTWTKSGHIQGRAKKIRARARPTAGSVSYALLLGYLTGARGRMLFQTEYAKLLDCSFDTIIEFAEVASRKGWIVFKRIGEIIEVLFPNLIDRNEMEWVREQN